MSLACLDLTGTYKCIDDLNDIESNLTIDSKFNNQSEMIYEFNSSWSDGSGKTQIIIVADNKTHPAIVNGEPLDNTTYKAECNSESLQNVVTWRLGYDYRSVSEGLYSFDSESNLNIVIKTVNYVLGEVIKSTEKLYCQKKLLKPLE